MNDTVIFRDYTQAELDSQYDNRSRVPNHEEIYQARAEEAGAVLADFKTRLDVSYGPSGEETLDIYLPDSPSSTTGGAPVNVFLHGGYWYSRHKDDFRFLARGLVPAGAVLVIVNYALIPSVDLSELVRQCRAAVAWTYRNADAFGGDSDRIHVSGHSAGGHLTTMMMATDWPGYKDNLPADLVKSGLAISGIYDLEPIRMSYMQKTLRFTPEDVSAFSPITLTPATGAPLTVAVGGDESEEFLRQSEEFAHAWQRPGIDCSLKVVPGMNHFTILGEFADPKSDLTKAVQKQMGLG
jgi:arylformamidase